MYDEHDLIDSSLQQLYTVDGHTIEICIYRMPDTAWTLEVIDEYGNSTVWDDTFETDQMAFDEVLRVLREEGIASLIGEPSPARGPETTGPDPLGLIEPLSEVELEALEIFLASDSVSDETMLLDQLDGYLTAIVVGPVNLTPSQWYSGIWGPSEEHAPHFATAEDAGRIMEAILRHYNGLIGSFQNDAEHFGPLFQILTTDAGHEYVDAEMWAYGFMKGLNLCRAAWQPLLDDVNGPSWVEPMRLLGGEGNSDAKRGLTATPEQREALADRIESAVAAIYRFWLPYRQAGHELHLARTIRRAHPKVGRNDPCPCGSGKKFKKCCGVAGTLH